MNIVTFKGETSLDELMAKIFGDVAKQRPELRDRLLEANPHLKDLAALPQGTPIVVPDDAPGGEDTRMETMIDQISTAIDQTESRRTDVLSRRQTELKQKVTDAARVRTAAGDDKELLTRIDASTEKANERIAAIDVEKKALADALARARSSLPGRPGRRRSVRH